PKRLEKENKFVENPNVSYARFGDELFLFSDESEWNQTDSALAERTNFSELGETPRREDLHVVIQKGDLFERSHPEVPILFNKGRFLIVEVSSQQAHDYSKEGNATCWSLSPLQDNSIIYDVRRPDSFERSEVVVPWVQSLVDKLQMDSLKADLEHFVSYPNRYSTGEHFRAAADWAKNQLQAMGFNARLETISVGAGNSQNVIAEKPGNTANTRQCVLVVAHLDSVNHDGGTAAIAPGADDNGSGSAGLLAMARALKDHIGRHDLRFILFGGEEQGLQGSQQYLATLSSAERRRIKAVINMDMIGTLNTSAPTVLIEGASVSQPVIDGLANTAAVYTELVVQTSLNPFNSDHVPFIRAGIPCVLTIEGADSSNSNIHSGNDTLAHIDYDLAFEILRMNVAFTATSIER
ncbi:MAG: M28 family metallopeptidase, partial [Acidobacteria bacterium]|nr:M28 family metallopeptidase [Acidobacteriota bacterium]